MQVRVRGMVKIFCEQPMIQEVAPSDTKELIEQQLLSEAVAAGIKIEQVEEPQVEEPQVVEPKGVEPQVVEPQADKKD